MQHNLAYKGAASSSSTAAAVHCCVEYTYLKLLAAMPVCWIWCLLQCKHQAHFVYYWSLFGSSAEGP
jgi:hypothetical protein